MSTGSLETSLHLLTTFLFQERVSGEPWKKHRVKQSRVWAAHLPVGWGCCLCFLDPVFFLVEMPWLPGASPAVPGSSSELSLLEAASCSPREILAAKDGRRPVKGYLPPGLCFEGSSKSRRVIFMRGHGGEAGLSLKGSSEGNQKRNTKVVGGGQWRG